MFIHSRLLLDECTCFLQRCFSLQRSTRPRKTSVKKSVEETYRSWLQKRLINSFRFSKMTRWRNLWFFIHQSSFFRTICISVHMYIFLYIIIFLVLFLNGNDYFYFTVQKEKYDSFLFFFFSNPKWFINRWKRASFLFISSRLRDWYFARRMLFYRCR